MARPKKHAFPLAFLTWHQDTLAMRPTARAAYLELVWWQHRMGAETIPNQVRILAGIARVSSPEWRRIADDVLPLVRARCTTQTRADRNHAELSTATCGNRVDGLRKSPPRTPDRLFAGTKYVPYVYPVHDDLEQKERSSPVGSPSSDPPTFEANTTNDLLQNHQLDSAHYLTASVPGDPGDAPDDDRAPGPPEGGDDRALASWLILTALRMAGGQLRGDLLRAAVYALSQAHGIRPSATTMAWSVFSWRSLPEVTLRESPDQPATADPGHPEWLVCLESTL
jgi:hypothetical protein